PGFDVDSLDRLAGDQVFRSNAQYPVDPADAVRRRAGVRVVRARMARDSRFGSGLGTRIAVGVRALAMARSASRASRINSSLLDSQLERFLLPPCVVYGYGICD